MKMPKALKVVHMSKKQKAFELFSQGMRPSNPEVKSLGLKPKSLYNYFQEFKHSFGGEQLIEKENTDKEAPAKVIPKGVKGGLAVTDALSQTSYLQLVPQVQQLPLTPDIFMSYGCALKKGYEGTFADWLSLVCRDFWFGREIDMYAEVSGITPSGDKGQDNG